MRGSHCSEYTDCVSRVLTPCSLFTNVSDDPDDQIGIFNTLRFPGFALKTAAIVPPKRWFPPTRRYWVTTPKTTFRIKKLISKERLVYGQCVRARGGGGLARFPSLRTAEPIGRLSWNLVWTTCQWGLSHDNTLDTTTATDEILRLESPINLGLWNYFR